MGRQPPGKAIGCETVWLAEWLIARRTITSAPLHERRLISRLVVGGGYIYLAMPYVVQDTDLSVSDRLSQVDLPPK